MMVAIKILILLIALIRLFLVTYDTFYNSFVKTDTKYFVEKFAEKDGRIVSEGYLKELAERNVKKHFAELMLLYMIILVIGVI